MKNLINNILSKFGLILVKKENWQPKHKFQYLNIPENVHLTIKETSMLNELRLINIIDTINYVSKNKIEGSLVECGVWKGGSVALMAYQLKILNDIRDLHLFDAFDDICEPDASIDGERAINDVGGFQNATGKLAPITGVYNQLGGKGNEIEVAKLITDKIGYPSQNVFIHKGWFQDTLPLVNDTIGKISILRLDGDWYASTKVCLDNLYQNVVVGGVIIIDDYGCYEGCKKAVDEFLEKNKIVAYLINIDDECVFWVKQ